jgi:hypothetical protein
MRAAVAELSATERVAPLTAVAGPCHTAERIKGMLNAVTVEEVVLAGTVTVTYPTGVVSKDCAWRCGSQIANKDAATSRLSGKSLKMDMGWINLPVAGSMPLFMKNTFSGQPKFAAHAHLQVGHRRCALVYQLPVAQTDHCSQDWRHGSFVGGNML